MSYLQFQDEVLQLYSTGDFQATLKLIEEQGKNYPEKAATVDLFHMCLLNVCGNSERALQVFQAAIDKGFWYQTPPLRGDPDLASLQGNPQFQRLVDICAERHAQAQRDAKPELLVLPPAQNASQPYPLLLALHWYGGNAHDFAEYWKSLTEQGWLVAAAQSSQVSGFNAYCWDDPLKAITEIKAHYAALAHDYPLDPQRVVLGGFSQGAGLAFWLSVSQDIPAAGFISIGPYLEKLVEMKPQLPAGAIPGVRGYFISGGKEQDDGMFAQVEVVLKEHTIPYQWHIYPELAHHMPADFDQRLQIALGFIFPQSK
jgi:predicted esterase